MIIGIALVVDELNKGQRLVFRYPDRLPREPFIRNNDELLRLHKEPDSFAKLFRPKAAMTNKILELVIDDLQFFSFPSPCVEDSSQNSSTDFNAKNNIGGFVSATGSHRDIISLFNVVIVAIKRSALHRILKSHLLNMQAKISATINNIISSSLIGHHHGSSSSNLFSSSSAGGVNVWLAELNRKSNEISHELQILDLINTNAMSNSNGYKCNIEDCFDRVGVSGFDPLVSMISCMLPPEMSLSAKSVSEDSDQLDFSEDLELYNDIRCSRGCVDHYCRVSDDTIRRALELFSRALLYQERKEKYVTTQVALMMKLVERKPDDKSQIPIVSRNGSTDSYIPSDINGGSSHESGEVNFRTLSGISNTDSLSLSSSNSSNSLLYSGLSRGSTSSSIALNVLDLPVRSSESHGNRHHGRHHGHHHGHGKQYNFRHKDDSLQVSSLANELRSLFNGLKGGYAVALTINGYISLNFRLLDDKLYDNHQVYCNKPTAPDSVFRFRGRTLEPYLTVMLVGEPAVCIKLLAALDANSSSGQCSANIESFIYKTDITKNFLELSNLMNVHLHEVYSIAILLCSWDLARIMPTVSSTSVFVIHPNTPLLPSSVPCSRFTEVFLEGKLSESPVYLKVLALFNECTSLEKIFASEVFKQLKGFQSALEVIVWLLRWNIVLPVTKSLVMLAPSLETITDEKLSIHRVRLMSEEDSCAVSPGADHVEEDAIANKLISFIGKSKVPEKHREKLLLKRIKNNYFYCSKRCANDHQCRMSRVELLYMKWRENISEDDVLCCITNDPMLQIVESMGY